MKTKMYAAVTALVLLLLPSLSSASNWRIDPAHTNIQFSVRHMMISNVKGIFHSFSGSFDIDDRDITKSSAKAQIDVASVDTGIDKRDEDLRSANFFDVARYPVMIFTSKKIVRNGSNRFTMTGDLTIHGVTREVVLEIEGLETVIKDPWGNLRRGATLTTEINRKEFGLNYNKLLETGGVVVGNEVKINIELELVKE